jgi:hypothetical protein
MSKWDSRIRDHAVWKALEQVGPAIDKAATRTDLSVDAVDSLDRARAVNAFIGRKLASMESRISPPGPLDSMVGQLNQATQALSSFEANGDIGSLDAVHTYLDAAASSIPHLHAPVNTDDLSGIGTAAAAYRDAVEVYAAKLAATTSKNQKQADEVGAALGKLEKAIEGEQAKIATLVAEYQSQFSTGQAARLDESAKAEAARKEKFDQELKTFGASFEEVQATRARTFGALIDDFSAKLDTQKSEFSTQGTAALEAYKAHIAELKENFAVAAEQVYDEVKLRKEEVEKLVGIIGNLGVSSGYQKTANSARTALMIWQGITVASLIGVVGVAIASFIPQFLEGKPIPWEVLAAKLIVVITVGILAAYAGSQADKQYQIERRNRKLALGFEALGPFLAPLTEAEQNKFRLEIGDRSFGRDEDEKGFERSPVTMLDLIAEIQKKDPGFLDKLKEATSSLLDRVLKKP